MISKKESAARASSPVAQDNFDHVILVGFTISNDLSLSEPNLAVNEGFSNPVFSFSPEFPTDSNSNLHKEYVPDSNESLEEDHEDHEYVGPKVYTGIKKYAGLLLSLFASFCFSLTILFVKILSDHSFNAYGTSFWRYIGTTLPAIPLLLFYECGPGTKKQKSVFSGACPIFKNRNWRTWVGLLSRGFLSSTSVILRYFAIQYLTIGEASVIIFSAPGLVTIMAHFILGEKCSVFQIVVAFVTLCGVAIVTKPPILSETSHFDPNTLIGTGFACSSLLCSALVIIMTRKVREVHFSFATFIYGLTGMSQSVILIYFLSGFNLPEGLFDSLLVAGVAVLSFIAQMAIVLALKYELAGPVALIRSCDVLFAYLFQYIFLHVVPDIFGIVGSAMVLAGILSTGFRKWLNTLPADDKRRERWWFVLK